MKLIPPTTNLVSLLVFLGVGTRFMKPGLDVRLLVWDHLILFNITLSDKSIVVKDEKIIIKIQDTLRIEDLLL